VDSLPAGKYTLWTIPKEDSWQVIFNSKQYPWGVNDAMEAMCEPEFNVVTIDVPVEYIPNSVEQFTIAFDNSTDNLSLTMAWDKTKIVVPLK
jgi:tagatose-1,6-bisphosphate aldolase